MKKILISVVALLFLSLAIILITQGIALGENFKVNGISGLKELKESLNSKIRAANELKIKNYPEVKDKL